MMHQASALVQSSKLEPALELEPEEHALEPERGSERVWVPEPELEQVYERVDRLDRPQDNHQQEQEQEQAVLEALQQLYYALRK